ncbi:MAG: hypothetical protein QM594_00305 [Niabella sp.]
MYKQPLLSSKFRLIGLLAAAISIIIYLINGVYNARTFWYIKFPVITYEEPFGEKAYFTFSKVPVYDTVIGVLFLIGLMFIAFSKIKQEDEYSYAVRLNSWLWAIWVNCILLVFSFFFFYGLSFFAIVVCNLYSLLIIFILRFYYLLYKNSKLKAL